MDLQVERQQWADRGADPRGVGPGVGLLEPHMERLGEEDPAHGAES